MRVGFTVGDQTVDEDVGKVELCLQLDHPSLVPVSVTLITQPGTAVGKQARPYSDTTFRYPILKVVRIILWWRRM